MAALGDGKSDLRTYAGGFMPLASWFVWVQRLRRMPGERVLLAMEVAQCPVTWMAAPGEALSIGVSGG